MIAVTAMTATSAVGEYRPREQGLRREEGGNTNRLCGLIVGEYRPREQGLRPRYPYFDTATYEGVGEYRPREQGLRLAFTSFASRDTGR